MPPLPPIVFNLSWPPGGGCFPLLLGKGFALRNYLKDRFPGVPFVYSGVSSGCFCALLLIMNYSEAEIFALVNRLLVAPFERKWYAVENFCLWFVLRHSLEQILATEDVEALQDRLFIGTASLSLTTRAKKNLVHRFASRRDVVQAVLTSCHLLFLGRHPARLFQNKLNVDGGLVYTHVSSDDIHSSFPKGQTKHCNIVTFRIGYDDFPRSLLHFRQAQPFFSSRKWKVMYELGKTRFQKKQQEHKRERGVCERVEKNTSGNIVVTEIRTRQLIEEFQKEIAAIPQPPRSRSQVSGLSTGWIEVFGGYLNWTAYFIWSQVLNFPL